MKHSEEEISRLAWELAYEQDQLHKRKDKTNGPNQDANEDWPKPTPLPEGLSPVDDLDPALLPEAIGPWVFDISDRMQCPPDYPAVAALVALGSVLGRKIGIRPQKKPIGLK
jgi:hypothetical protein